MADLSEVAPFAVGLAPWGLQFLWGRFLRRADSAEERLEKEEAARASLVTTKLDHLLEKVAGVERDMSLLVEKLSGQASEVREVKARVEGMSGSYGPRLAALELDLRELKTRFGIFESKANK